MVNNPFAVFSPVNHMNQIHNDNICQFELNVEADLPNFDLNALPIKISHGSFLWGSAVMLNSFRKCVPSFRCNMNKKLKSRPAVIKNRCSSRVCWDCGCFAGGCQMLFPNCQ